MKLLKRISGALLLALLCNAVSAQTHDTISATYSGAIYSRDSAVCFAGGCSYTLSLPIPAGFTIKDVRCSFNYRVVGSCNLNQAGWDLKYRTCRNPETFNTWHTCTIGLPGLCILQNIDVYPDIESCILPVQDTGYNMDFTLTFYRCVNPTSEDTCGPSCCIADSPWSMTVEGTQDTSATDVREASLSNFYTLYPNPSQGCFTIQSDFIKSDNIDAEIYNVLGERVYSQIIREDDIKKGYQLRLNSSSGLYLLVLRADNAVMSKKNSILK